MKIKKLKNFKYNLICIDGFYGSGKTLLAPILSTYKNVQNQQISYNFDNLLILNYLNLLKKNSCKEMINFVTDEIAFNYEIGRNLNLRIMDHTGLKFNPNAKADIKKIFENNEERSLKKLISKNNVTLNLMSHKTFLLNELLSNIFLGKKYLHLVMVRHPVFLFDHYLNFFKSTENTEKNFIIYFEFMNGYIPWFCKKIKNKKLKMPDLIVEMFEFIFLEITKLNKNAFVIPFEEFVIKPDYFLKKIEQKIKIKRNNKKLKIEMKSSNLPRKKINHGHKYVKYGFVSEESDKIVYFKEYNKIISKLSSVSIKKFDRIIKNYNKTYSKQYSNFI